MDTHYTFKNARKCRHCSKAIADQAHATIQFCPREELPDGSIKSCKDDFHVLKNKDINLPYLQLAKYHKEINQRIKKLLSEKGDTVTTGQINQYGIRLDKAVQIQPNPNQQTAFYFIGYCLTLLTQSTLKIVQHENTF